MSLSKKKCGKVCRRVWQDVSRSMKELGEWVQRSAISRSMLFREWTSKHDVEDGWGHGRSEFLRARTMPFLKEENECWGARWPRDNSVLGRVGL